MAQQVVPTVKESSNQELQSNGAPSSQHDVVSIGISAQSTFAAAAPLMRAVGSAAAAGTARRQPRFLERVKQTLAAQRAELGGVAERTQSRQRNRTSGFGSSSGAEIRPAPADTSTDAVVGLPVD